VLCFVLIYICSLLILDNVHHHFQAVIVIYILLLRTICSNINEIHESTKSLNISRKELVIQKKATDAFLYHVLPRHIADQFKAKSGASLHKFQCVTVLFTNIVGFTRDVRLTCDPNRMAKLLNDIEEFFDERIRSFNVYKLETMGESHMVVSGNNNNYKNTLIDPFSWLFKFRIVSEPFMIPRKPYSLTYVLSS